MTYPIDASLGTYASNNGLSGTYIPEIWSGKLLEKFYEATVLAAIANTDHEGEISAYGDKVIIRTQPDVTIRDYSVGMNLQYERLRADNVELLIDQGKYFAYPMNAVEKKQSDIDFLSAWAENASQQMKITIDRAILNDIYADVDSNNAGSSAGAIDGSINLGTTGTPLEITTANVIDVITQCGQCLTEQNIPEQDRWMVIPAWFAQRIKNSELKDASLTGDGKSILRNGRIGMIDGFVLYTSNCLTGVTDGSDTCFHALFGHKSALTFASQLVENETLKNPTDFGDLVRGLQVYGYKVQQPTAMGDLYVTKG